MIQHRALSDTVFFNLLNLLIQKNGGTNQPLQKQHACRQTAAAASDYAVFSRGEFCRWPMSSATLGE